MSKPYAVFLRGVNLGRARRVGMADLREALADAGFEEAKTLLASGNVVLQSPLAAGKLTIELEKVLEARFGSRIPIIVRTKSEIQAILRLDPLTSVVENPSRYQVTFFEEKVPAELTKALQKLAKDDEQIKADGRELYAWHPNGISKSAAADELAKRMSKDPAARTTSRNWNTVKKTRTALETMK